MKKQMLSFLCAASLCLSLLPAAAFAEEPTTPTTTANKTLMLGATSLQGAQQSNVYYGTYKQSSDGNNGFNIDPIKWRVLSNRDGKLLLLSDRNLDVFRYHTDFEKITWEKSTMRSWLNGYTAGENDGDNAGIDSTTAAENKGVDYSTDNFIDNAFSSAEKNTIVKTTVINKTYEGTEGENPNPSYGTSGGNDTEDQIFLLSIAEAQNTAYGFTDNTSDSATRASINTAYVANGGEINSSDMTGSGVVDSWWLRSPGFDSRYAAYVHYNGSMSLNGGSAHFTDFAVRPAFNIDSSKVLFTSAAENGKSVYTYAAAPLTAIADYNGNEWKLTLLDSSRDFKVTESTATTYAGGTVQLTYSGATQGNGQYISVILADSTNTPLYYGKVKQTDAATDGNVDISIPNGLADGTYKLHVFSEQDNGDKKTDYASAFQTVTLTIDNPPVLTAGTATRTSESTATVKFTSSEAGAYYYAVEETGATAPTINTGGAGTACDTSEQTISLTTLTTGAKDIYIVAKDTVGNVSDTLKIAIPELVPVYSISADTEVLNFGTVLTDYTAPDAQTVTVTNHGNVTVNLIQPTATNYEIGTLSKTSLAPNETAAFTVQPKSELSAGSYGEVIHLTDTNGSFDLSFSANFEVQTPPVTNVIYTVIVSEVEGGTASVSATRVKAGSTVTVTVTPDAGYTVDELIVKNRWTDVTVTVTDNGDGTYSFTQPYGSVIVSATFKPIETAEPEEWTSPFTDVPDGEFYTEAVAWASARGITNGMTETEFGVNEACNRAHIITFLWRAAGCPAAEGNVSFTDVVEGEFYAEAVKWAASLGIVNGYGDGSFGVNDTVTREQVAVMLYRYVQSQGGGFTGAWAFRLNFEDVAEISDWALEGISWCVMNGVMEGYEGRLTPQEPCNRAQIVTMLFRALR